MAVIRDVMPAFELFQPASIEDAQAVLDRYGAGALVLAGGLDSFDWLKDRIKRPQALVDLAGIPELKGIRPWQDGLENRRDDHAHRGRTPSGRARAVCHPARGGGSGRVAADSQPGHDRRQRLAGHTVLVLPRRVALLSRRRQHLLCRHPRGDQPRARHPGRRPLRGRQPVRHRAGADRAGRADGDSHGCWPRADRGGRRLLCRARHRHHADDDPAARRSADRDSVAGCVGGCALLFREGARPPGVGISRSSAWPRRW